MKSGWLPGSGSKFIVIVERLWKVGRLVLAVPEVVLNRSVSDFPQYRAVIAVMYDTYVALKAENSGCFFVKMF